MESIRDRIINMLYGRKYMYTMVYSAKYPFSQLPANSIIEIKSKIERRTFHRDDFKRFYGEFGGFMFIGYRNNEPLFIIEN